MPDWMAAVGNCAAAHTRHRGSPRDRRRSERRRGVRAHRHRSRDRHGLPGAGPAHARLLRTREPSQRDTRPRLKGQVGPPPDHPAASASRSAGTSAAAGEPRTVGEQPRRQHRPPGRVGDVTCCDLCPEPCLQPAHGDDRFAGQLLDAFRAPEGRASIGQGASASLSPRRRGPVRAHGVLARQVEPPRRRRPITCDSRAGRDEHARRIDRSAQAQPHRGVRRQQVDAVEPADPETERPGEQRRPPRQIPIAPRGRPVRPGRVQAGNDLARAKQDSARRALGARHAVQHPVRAVGEVLVEQAGPAEHRRVAGSETAIGVRARVLADTAIRLDLRQAHDDRPGVDRGTKQQRSDGRCVTPQKSPRHTVTLGARAFRLCRHDSYYRPPGPGMR